MKHVLSIARQWLFQHALISYRTPNIVNGNGEFLVMKGYGHGGYQLDQTKEYSELMRREAEDCCGTGCIFMHVIRDIRSGRGTLFPR